VAEEKRKHNGRVTECQARRWVALDAFGS